MVRAVSDLLSPLFCCSLSLFYNISRFLSSLFVTGLTGRDRLQHDTMENIENVALKVLVCFFLRIKKSRIRKKNEQTHTTDISTQAKRTSANERLKDGERERSRVRHRKEAGVVSNEKKKVYRYFFQCLHASRWERTMKCSYFLVECFALSFELIDDVDANRNTQKALKSNRIKICCYFFY